MAQNETKSLSRKVLQADVNANSALKAITDYKPANTAYTQSLIETSKNEMEAAQTLAVQKKAEYESAKDAQTAKEWNFHNKILGAKDQITAQYGKNSDELQSLGLKKTSDYGKKRTSKPSEPK